MDFRPAYALSRKLLKPRKANPLCVVIHTTGPGPWRRWKAAGTGEPFDQAVRVYTEIYRYCPHVVISGEDGRVIRVVPDSFAAMHVVSAGHHSYRSNPRAVPAWWKNTFPGLKSPLDLAGGGLWSLRSVNTVSLAIEVSPPKGGAAAPWSDATYSSLASTVSCWANEYSIPVLQEYIITHSEAHPLSRTTKSGKPWDPSPAQFDKARLLATVAPAVVSP